MTLPVTAAMIALALAFAGFSGWRGAQAARPHARPRLIPWRLLMLISVTVVIALLVHAVGLVRDPGGLAADGA